MDRRLTADNIRDHEDVYSRLPCFFPSDRFAAKIELRSRAKMRSGELSLMNFQVLNVSNDVQIYFVVMCIDVDEVQSNISQPIILTKPASLPLEFSLCKTVE